MSTQVSRDHHTVPKLYLKGFAGRKGREKNMLMARQRGGSDELVSIKHATVELDFYDVGDTDADDALEVWFATQVENPVGEVMDGLRKTGVLPAAGDAARTHLATFVAFQMVRTVRFRYLMQELSEHLGPVLWANAGIQAAMAKDPSLRELSEPELTELHMRIAQRAPEDVRTASTSATLRNMVREADRLRPLLESMNWLLTSSKQPLLISGDAPVVAIDGSGKIRETPESLPEFHEIHLPLSPNLLLTLSPLVQLGGPSVLSEKQAELVNAAIVRNCANAVFRSPSMPWPDTLSLPPARAPLHVPHYSFSVRPDDAPAADPPAFPAASEAKFAHAMALLGGDPDLG